MYKLYYHPISQPSRRVLALLEQAKLPFDKHVVNLRDNEHNSPEYLAINPNHQVPTLLDGDVKIHESNATLRYLCIKHDLNDWYPQNDLALLAACEQWLDWNQCRLGTNVGAIVFNTLFAGENADQQAIERGKKGLEEVFPILSDGIGKNPFVCGDKPTIADLSLASNFTHLSFVKIEPEQQNLRDWYERVCALEGFGVVMEEVAAFKKLLGLD